MYMGLVTCRALCTITLAHKFHILFHQSNGPLSGEQRPWLLH